MCFSFYVQPPPGDSCVIGLQQPFNDKEMLHATEMGRRPSDLGIEDKDQQHVQKADLSGSSEVVDIDDGEQLVKHAGAGTSSLK